MKYYHTQNTIWWLTIYHISHLQKFTCMVNGYIISHFQKIQLDHKIQLDQNIHFQTTLPNPIEVDDWLPCCWVPVSCERVELYCVLGAPNGPIVAAPVDDVVAPNVPASPPPLDNVVAPYVDVVPLPLEDDVPTSPPPLDNVAAPLDVAAPLEDAIPRLAAGTLLVVAPPIVVVVIPLPLPLTALNFPTLVFVTPSLQAQDAYVHELVMHL